MSFGGRSIRMADVGCNGKSDQNGKKVTLEEDGHDSNGGS